MLLLTYGLYDGVAKEYVRTFTSKNDEVAQRAADYIVRESNFDKIAGKDMVINYLYAMDTETGKIVDNNIHVICSLGTALANYENEATKTRLEELINKQLHSNMPSEEVKKDVGSDNA